MTTTTKRILSGVAAFLIWALVCSGAALVIVANMLVKTPQ